MSAIITSSLTVAQRKKLLSLFNNAKLHLLYKASVHNFYANQFHNRCDKQGPTVCVAYNPSGFIYGAYTSKDFAQTTRKIIDEHAFLFSIHEDRPMLVQVRVNWDHPAFEDATTGPNFGTLLFLNKNTATVRIRNSGGEAYTFDPAELFGGDLTLTEFEVYRVEEIGAYLSKPWRNIQWTEDKREELIKKIQSYCPNMKSVKETRLLLVGPVGAGKSSFCNSINSVFRGHMTSRAIAGTAGKSVTVQFRTYTITASKGRSSVPLILCDTMGLEEEDNQGLNPNEVMNICKGHVPDHYQFNPQAPLQEGAAGYKKHVTLKDKIHCLVYVVDASRVSLMSQKILDNFTTIREKANHMGIPQILLMTKIDEACPLVEEDLKNVYHSAHIQKKAREASVTLGIPLSCIVPIKNYFEELELNLEADVLLLSAVELMRNYADSFFENQTPEDNEETD
ncbi:hypothetical protein WMY93_016635 [Mugilogobius chulae]|uniref:TLDc domain-containing protein n=1 Tax=Mugilogobius chulae TaxID=88201 RepID=A0AAW0NM54_9GOBI